MGDVRRAAVIGTGTMGPGMGAVLARAGIDTALYDVSEEALERAKTGAELAAGVLDRLEAPKADGGAVRFETIGVVDGRGAAASRPSRPLRPAGRPARGR